MDSCICVDAQGPAEEQLFNCQYIADLFIAIAYFSIPLELIYFVQKSAFFPYKWVLIQFGAFIILCGATHFINLWTSSMHSKTIAIMMTIAKMSTALVSCATALMLVHILPDLLCMRRKEFMLRSRVDELDKEKGLVLKQEETGRHVRMLTHEIRSTLDKQTILRTTLVELGRILGLQECTLWMPSRRGLNLHVSHTLNNLVPVGSTVPISLPLVSEIFNSAKAIPIPHTCPLAGIRSPAGKLAPREAIAVRVPLLNLLNFEINYWPELSTKGFAVMVLILPVNGMRKWRDHELELVEVVADQVAVALSHAAILEESMRAREQLMEQNIALDLARQEAEIAIHARKNFLAVINHEMRTPIHAVISLCSLLLEAELTPEQRSMMETILKSGNLLATLVNDVLDLSRLEDGSLELDNQPFDLHGLFKEVVALIKPIAAVKKLAVSLTLAPDLPVDAVGDENRLMQIMLNVVGNAIKFTKEGYIEIEVSAPKQDYTRDWELLEHHPAISNGQFDLKVQVKDSGCGVIAEEIPLLFTRFTEPGRASPQQNGSAGLGLAISKRFINLMGGHIWIESEGNGKGTTVTFLIRVGTCEDPSRLPTRPAIHRANKSNGDTCQYQQFGREFDGIYLSISRHKKSY